MLKTILKGLGIVVGIIAGLTLLLFIAMSIPDSPTYAWRLIRYGQSDTQDYKIFPEHPIEKGSVPSTLPREDQSTPYEVEYPYDEQRARKLSRSCSKEPIQKHS